MLSLIASLVTHELSECFVGTIRRDNQKNYQKALKVIFNSDDGYDELLQMNNEITIHQEHFHALICEVFESLKNSYPESMWSFSQLKI